MQDKVEEYRVQFGNATSVFRGEYIHRCGYRNQRREIVLRYCQ